MSILNLLSDRQKRRAQSGQPDVYQYDTLPKEFRYQVIHIWMRAIGAYEQRVYHPDSSYQRLFESLTGHAIGGHEPLSNATWTVIHDRIAEHAGKPFLGNDYEDPFERCQRYFLSADSTGALDIIEFSFRVIDRVLRQLPPEWLRASGISQDPDSAIEDLNEYFQIHGIGYQFEAGALRRLDQQYTHAKIVRPALAALRDAGFSGPSDEFDKALRRYREGHYADAITMANHAFEGTMQAICDVRKWSYPPTATASKLIEVVLDHELVERSMQDHFTGLKKVLEAGLPTVRNKTKGSGHSQGSAVVQVPAYLARYAINMAAANIVFLIEAHRAK